MMSLNFWLKLFLFAPKWCGKPLLETWVVYCWNRMNPPTAQGLATSSGGCHGHGHGGTPMDGSWNSETLKMDDLGWFGDTSVTIMTQETSISPPRGQPAAEVPGYFSPAAGHRAATSGSRSCGAGRAGSCCSDKPGTHVPEKGWRVTSQSLQVWSSLISMPILTAYGCCKKHISFFWGEFRVELHHPEPSGQAAPPSGWSNFEERCCSDWSSAFTATFCDVPNRTLQAIQPKLGEQ